MDGDQSLGHPLVPGGGQRGGLRGAADSKLYAFSAAGTTACSGTPKICKPLWTGTTDALDYSDSAPVVANGVVYVGSSDTKFYAFSR